MKQRSGTWFKRQLLHGELVQIHDDRLAYVRIAVALLQLPNVFRVLLGKVNTVFDVVLATDRLEHASRIATAVRIDPNCKNTTLVNTFAAQLQFSWI